MALASDKKRFIAGAVCPQCQAQDKIFVLILPSGEEMRCNACDYIRTKDDGSGEWQTVQLPEIEP